MTPGKVFLICLLAFASIMAYAQEIDGLVLDADTMEPVADVFVFVANSSTGATTSKDGAFKLPVDDPAGVQIFFSHLGYEILAIEYEIKVTGKTEIFLLVPTDLELIQSLVVAKSKPGIRRRRLRDFKEAFLGEVSSNRVQIDNSETILFQEEDNRLIVTTSEPISITNKELGYTVQFYLKSFERWDDQAVGYKGSAYFDEMEGNRSQQARFRKNRKKAYKRSSMKFFRDLAGGKYHDYQIGMSVLGEDNSFDHFTEIDSLAIAVSDNGHYSIQVDGCLTIVNQSIATRSNTSREKASAEFSFLTTSMSSSATSYLCPKDSQISFSKNGRILNAGEVEEFGFWTTQRVGSLLPFGYEP